MTVALWAYMAACVVIVCLLFVLTAYSERLAQLRAERDALRQQLDREKFLHQRFDGSRS